MELYQLRSLAAVAQAGHLTRAAEGLHLSQPAVSAHVRVLEEELGVKLFERSSNGMLPTHAGRELVQHAERVLAAAAAMRNAARALKGEVEGRLRVGTVIDPDTLRLGAFLSRTTERYPGIDLELHHEVSGEAMDAVRSGELDASFYFGALSQPEIRGVRLAEMQYRVVAPAAWAARVRDADWKALAALPWVLTLPSSTLRGIARALFRANGVAPERVVEADNEYVISTLVASGLGLSLMREELAREKEAAGEVVVLDAAGPSVPLWFIHRADRTDDPLIIALTGALREAWGLTAARDAREPAEAAVT
ncbi:MAG TPA: LysR family transcriptional regulator [Burkholderiales bacterium]